MKKYETNEVLYHQTLRVRTIFNHPTDYEIMAHFVINLSHLHCDPLFFTLYRTPIIPESQCQ